MLQRIARYGPQVSTFNNYVDRLDSDQSLVQSKPFYHWLSYIIIYWQNWDIHVQQTASDFCPPEIWCSWSVLDGQLVLNIA